MNHRILIEERLEHWLSSEHAASEVLQRSMRHAVLGGGKRLRPQLTLMVADSCGATESELELALDAAVAIELIHCASLVHDDLPCFDDAEFRRGRPTVHMLFGEPMAILTGDALITLAFEVLGSSAQRHACRAMRICRLLARAAGPSEGLIGGQSMEAIAELQVFPEEMARYHAMKTAALFRVAAEAGAMAANATTVTRWGTVGRTLGLAYQLADDLFDVGGNSTPEGKPVGQDATHGRPNAAISFGAIPTRMRILAMIDDVRDHIHEITNRRGELLAMLDAFENPLNLRPASPPSMFGSSPPVVALVS